MLRIELRRWLGLGVVHLLLHQVRPGRALSPSGEVLMTSESKLGWRCWVGVEGTPDPWMRWEAWPGGGITLVGFLIQLRPGDIDIPRQFDGVGKLGLTPDAAW